jgi:hypothetical protein
MLDVNEIKMHDYKSTSHRTTAQIHKASTKSHQTIQDITNTTRTHNKPTPYTVLQITRLINQHYYLLSITFFSIPTTASLIVGQ